MYNLIAEIKGKFINKRLRTLFKAKIHWCFFKLLVERWENFFSILKYFSWVKFFGELKYLKDTNVKVEQVYYRWIWIM